MKLKLQNLIHDINGATAIEYSLLIAGIGVVVFAALEILGVGLANVFTTVASAM